MRVEGVCGPLPPLPLSLPHPLQTPVNVPFQSHPNKHPNLVLLPNEDGWDMVICPVYLGEGGAWGACGGGGRGGPQLRERPAPARTTPTHPVPATPRTGSRSPGASSATPATSTGRTERSWLIPGEGHRNESDQEGTLGNHLLVNCGGV